jgi:site-specific recombinase XerD
MTTRQLPLFPTKPEKPEHITKKTPVGETMRLFSEHLTKEGKSEHTVKAFIGDMDLLIEHTGAQTQVNEYTTTKLNDFLNWMEFGRGVPCSRKTYARRVTTLKVYFRWLHGVGAIPYDPAKAVLQRSGPAPLSEALNPEQILNAIDASRRMKKNEDIDYRPELLFQLLLQTGIKKSETARIKAEDFDRSNPERPTVFIRQKAKDVYRERRIEIEPELITLLDFYLSQYAPKAEVFTCTTRNLEYILTDTGEMAGIPFKLSFEVMRWTSAVRDWRAGVEEEIIREKLGLSKISWYETGNKIRRIVEHQLNEENFRMD